MGLLKTSHVRLSGDEDLLIWNQSKSGKYTPRSGYLQLLMDRQEENYPDGGRSCGNSNVHLKQKFIAGSC